MLSSKNELNRNGVGKVKVDGQAKKDFLWLREVMESCYGPWGTHIILQPMEGGAITRTRHTHQMLDMLKAHTPMLRLITSHLQAHSRCYRDSTLYAGILATNLIVQGLELEVARVVSSEEVCLVMCEVCEWLKGGCSVSYQLDLSSTSSLLHLVRSFITPKLSSLPCPSIQLLATLIVQAMLKALPQSSSETIGISGRVSMMPLPYAITNNSMLFDGVLLSEEVWHSVDSFRLDCVQRDSHGVISTMLFFSSLAGDEEGGTGFGRKEVWLEGSGSVDMETEVGEVLLQTGHALLQRGVGMLICQKCVHPRLKDYLIGQGVLVLERVSGVRVQSVHGLCGGSLVSSISSQALEEAQLGMLKDVKLVNHMGRKFVQLIGCSDGHSTLTVCASSQHQAEEMEVVCRNALKVCEWCLGDPVLVSGAGCMDTAVAQLLRSKVQETEGSPARKCVLQMMCSCFEQQVLALHSSREGVVILTDSAHHHCWTLPPAAGEDRDECTRCEDGERWRQLLRGTSCSCGGVSFSQLSPFTTWHRLHPRPSPLLSTHTSPTAAPKTTAQAHCKTLTHSTTCDLLTPRLAALQCAAELAQSVLITAYTITCHQ